MTSLPTYLAHSLIKDKYIMSLSRKLWVYSEEKRSNSFNLHIIFLCSEVSPKEVPYLSLFVIEILTTDCLLLLIICLNL